jgi:primosomal protein N' (replication factor Y) (superfamily II helicase)
VYAPGVDDGTAGPPVEEQTRVVTIAEVAVDGAYASASGGVLSYELPREWHDRIAVGQLVWVPLRKQVALGVVLNIHWDRAAHRLKSLRAPVEPAFRLNEDRLQVAAWLARATATLFFAAASPFFPPGVSHRAVEYLRLIDPETEQRGDLTAAQSRLVGLLSERGEVTVDAARAALGTSLAAVIPKLEGRGVIERVVQVVDRAPSPRTQRFVRLVVPDFDDIGRAPRQRAVVEYLVHRARLAPTGSDGLVPLADVLERTGTDHAVVGALARKGLVEEHVLPRVVAPEGGREAPAPALTPAQTAAWHAIERALVARDPTPFLLHGVTGSGKTEVYLRAVAWCLRHVRTAIVLVPEIALASQVVRRFQGRFPGQVAVVHSELPDVDRYATWQAIALGQRRIVVGPRSALFAPVKDLGLIVLDEEHEGAYKQEGEPRYHARALAECLAAQQGSVVLLGSATPAVETHWRAEQGEIRRLVLPSRVGPDEGVADGDRVRRALALPEVEIVDMRLELHRGNASILSDRLRELLEQTLARGEQSILFLNRRGLATVVLCRSCGTTLICPFCDIPLVYHQDRERLLCHRCNYRAFPPRACPQCGGGLNYFGAGTQRVELEVKRQFPDARVLRWDQDSVRRQGGHERLLRRIERREVDVVVGTQMIAKGLDLPLVTAIGVVHADTLLHLPDFRSAERTFQLLTQVAGRAGRRAPGGRVVVQSYTPAHYAIETAARHDYAAFFAEEIDFRRIHGYPPFTRLVRYLFRHQDEARCAAEAEEMARHLARHARSRNVPADLLGPTPAFATRVRGKYQWQIVLRAAPAALDALLDGLPQRPGWLVDVDPQSLL